MSFNIIHNLGDPQEADFEFKGKSFKVHREEVLFIREWVQFVPCAPYDNHFIFELPTKAIQRSGLSAYGMPEYLCTCGSVAVVKDYADPRKALFVCLFDANNGYHQTTIVDKDKFERYGGRTIEIDGSRVRFKDE